MNNPLKVLASLLFPEFCRGCGTRLLPEGQILCHECRESLVFRENVCEKCGSSLPRPQCRYCREIDFSFDAARSIFDFNKVIKTLIHELKYEEMTRVATFLSRYMSLFFAQALTFSGTDIIVPVPLHPVRKRSRGYNQSSCLARELAKKLKVEYIPDLVKRKRFTGTQTRLTRQERQKNVSGAFSLNPRHKIEGKNVLLVDDVFTTGSTVDSISKVLKNSQVRRINVLTIARA